MRVPMADDDHVKALIPRALLGPLAGALGAIDSPGSPMAPKRVTASRPSVLD